MVDRANILGVGVSAINQQMALVAMAQWIARRQPHYICVTGVHGLVESYRSEELRAVHNAAGLVTPDGMPLVWISRVMGFHQVERVYGPDLMLAACDQFRIYGCRHFFYGGAPGVAALLADRLGSRFDGLCIAGTYSPPFRDVLHQEDDAIGDQIKSTLPDIVWVGMSTPKQERWMAAHVGRVEAPVLVGVGAAFDFHAGIKRQAPRWMMRSGLEWLFRLISEPRRLGTRYLVNNPLFVGLIAMQALGLKRLDLNAIRSKPIMLAESVPGRASSDQQADLESVLAFSEARVSRRLLGSRHRRFRRT
jgi:N-acetylglucosaminyldiphosphoundecaprenol N-acetyl-beta-D-mannosaminyltransferase